MWPRIIFAVHNCLHVSDIPLGPGRVRSVFSVTDRLQQLLQETLVSISTLTRPIKEQVGVLILESSTLSVDEKTQIETQLQSLFTWSQLQMYDQVPHIALQRDHIYKGTAELMILKELLPTLPSSVEYLVKLSGRYSLTPDSNIRDMIFNTHHYGLYKFPGRKPSTTVICGIPRNLFNDFDKRLQHTIDTCSTQPISIEDVLFVDIDNYFHYQGATGRVSIDGTTWRI